MGAAAEASPASAEILSLPAGDGTRVLLDGWFEEGEWEDAAVHGSPGDTELRLKRHGEALYVGVRWAGLVPKPVDLFLTNGDGVILQIHASMATGQRVLAREGCTAAEAPWVWHRHPGWTANQAHLDRERATDLPWSRRLHPAEGVEFKVRHSLLSGSRWRLRLEIGTFPGDEGTVLWPADADCRDTGTWAVLEL